MLESELFGHERGSFTGAAATRQGRFQQAEGGTLFLDEIGDMPADLQVRLLRVLQDGEYYRVGGQAPMKSNVRIIAATHQNLDERVRQGMFREDLLHRLNVVRLRAATLRERREDVPLLMKHFLSKSAQTLGGEAKALTPAAMQVLQHFAFPGNVRQLENICHWITVMAPGSAVDVADLPPEVRSAFSAGSAIESPASAITAIQQDRSPRAPVQSESGSNSATINASAAQFNGNGHAIASPAGNGDWQHALAAAVATAIQQRRKGAWRASHSRVRSDHDSIRADANQRTSYRSQRVAGLGSQHANPEDSRTGHGRRSLTPSRTAVRSRRQATCLITVRPLRSRALPHGFAPIQALGRPPTGKERKQPHTVHSKSHTINIRFKQFAWGHFEVLYPFLGVRSVAAFAVPASAIFQNGGFRDRHVQRLDHRCRRQQRSDRSATV